MTATRFLLAAVVSVGTMASAADITVHATYLSQDRSWCPSGSGAVIEVLMDGPDVYENVRIPQDEQATVGVRRGAENIRIKTKVAGECNTSGSCPRAVPKAVRKVGRFIAEFEACQSLPEVSASGVWRVVNGSETVLSGDIKPEDRFNWRGRRAPFLQAESKERTDILLKGLGHLSALTAPEDYDLFLGNPSERSE